MSTIYIPIGSSCSVAKQLQNHGKRDVAFPLDWVRVDNFANVVKLFRTGFSNFTSVMTRGVDADKFPYLETDNFDINAEKKTIIVKNGCGVTFYHDFHSDVCFEDQLIIVKEKYDRRIERLLDTLKNTDNKVCFVRDELKMNRLKQTDIEDFKDFMDTNYLNLSYELKIIVHNPKKLIKPILKYESENIKIINDTEPFSSIGDKIMWERNNVDWESIFS